MTVACVSGLVLGVGNLGCTEIRAATYVYTVRMQLMNGNEHVDCSNLMSSPPMVSSGWVDELWGNDGAEVYRAGH